MKNEFMNFEVTPDYASPLLDTGFKQLLSLEGEGGDAVAVSFLNALVPDFQANPIKSLKSAPTYMRLTEGDESRPLTMDFNAVNNRGESIIIEIQLKRHIGFDERALFYAARTYSNQINEEKKQGQSFPGSWFVHLKKTYSIQVVGYNSAGAIGIENTHMKDTLIDRVAAHPMKDGDFLKHYVMTDRFSGQEIDYLQLIQLELPRAEAIMNLFPPANGFSVQQWWLSIFNHSKEYTSEYIEQLYKEGIMPNEIYSGLGRMKFAKWDRSIKEAYTKDLEEFKKFYAPQILMDLNDAKNEGIAIGKKESIAIGKNEGIAIGKNEGIAIGKNEGIAIGKKETALKLLSRGMSIDEITDITGLAEPEIQKLMH